MFATESITLFLLASIALDLAPGPDNLFVLTQSALHGKKAGILVTLGLCTGLIFHTTLVALGVAIIFQASAAMMALKIFGVTYLSYLAYKALSAKPVPFDRSITLTGAALYRRGIIMSSTNPKLSLFFFAFLPQFITPDSDSFVSQVFILGGLFAVTAFCIFCCIAYAGGALQQRLETSPDFQLSLNRIAGLVFIALAINLIL
ncbi:MAG TPA: LysE family translocator [Cycloclasticus sp.]|nr:LysE family translocator [Cycloclasticus sp.]